MASLIYSYLATKFIWEKFPAFGHVQSPEECRLLDATVALRARPHGLGSPLIIKVPRISQSLKQDAHTLIRRLIHISRGRLLLQLESPALEWWTFLFRLCRSLPADGVLQVSRPRCARTEVMDVVELKDALSVSGARLEILSFLNNIIAEASRRRSWPKTSRGLIEFFYIVQDSCAQTGAFFASLLQCCRTSLKSIVYDIFSVASLVNVYDSQVFVDPVTPPPHVIDAKDLKTVFVLVPFKLDRDSQLSAASIPDVASLVGRLFAEERLEVTDATLVVWACYPRELVDRGDHSETAVRSQLRKELEPHIERLRELAPIRISECGESRGAPPFRKVDLRVCPYEQWHAGGIAEIPVEVWGEVLPAGIEADGASSSEAKAEARAEARAGEAWTC